MSGKIYLLSDDDVLKPMEETPYDTELLLQEMLAKYPDLLAGEQIDSDDPRRWLLVTREMSIPGEDGGNGRWSLDHLFLDQDAVGFSVLETVMNGQSRSRLPADFLWFRAFPAMIVATVWFKAYPNDDRLAAEKCDYDNWLFGLA